MPDARDVDPQILAVLDAMTSGGGTEPFHDPFLSLDPTSVHVVTREQFTAALPLRRQLFASIGATGTVLRDVRVETLDEHHVLATTSWAVEFLDDAAEPLTLESSYVLRRDGDGWVVVVYLNHRDLGALVARRRRAA